jgi:hypothetical protein
MSKDDVGANKCKFAITLWKTNKTKLIVPLKEYSFHWCPVALKFFVSGCGKYIYFFLSKTLPGDDVISEYSLECQWVVVLDINTLREVRIITLPECNTNILFN